MLLALGYDRDKTGLITDITESRPAGEQSGAWHYGYDTLKRLSGATWTPSAGAATEYDYTYDRNGNRLSESVTGSATKYSRYNKLDQLLDQRTSAAYPGGTIQKSYAWDKHGRLSSESGAGVSPAIERLYTWSVDDRLESVQLGTNPTDPTVRYTYDHEGRMIKREKSQDVARFLVDNDNPTGYSQALAEVNADATKTTENYFYGDDFGPLAQVHNPGAAGFDQRFLYGDHLSTTRLLTTGLSSDQYSYYSPYGAMTQPAGGSSLTSYAFTGQSRDLDTGLQYHRARWLNTNQGRWLSEDPVFDWPGSFGSSYVYVGDSPVLALDLSGMGSYGELLVSLTIGLLMNTIRVGLAAGIISGLLFAGDAYFAGDDPIEGFAVGFVVGFILGMILYRSPAFFVKAVAVLGAFLGGVSAGQAIDEGNERLAAYRILTLGVGIGLSSKSGQGFLQRFLRGFQGRVAKESRAQAATTGLRTVSEQIGAEAGAISDDSLVHFAPVKYSTLRKETYFWRWGDIKAMNPKEIRYVIGEGATAGLPEPPGTRFMHIIRNANLEDFEQMPSGYYKRYIPDANVNEFISRDLYEVSAVFEIQG